MLGNDKLRMIKECKSEGFKTRVWKSKDNILQLTFSGANHQNEGVNKGVTLLYNQIARYSQKKRE